MPNKATCGNISCVHLFAPPHNKLYLSRPFLGTAHTQQNGFLRYQRFSYYGLLTLPENRTGARDGSGTIRYDGSQREYFYMVLCFPFGHCTCPSTVPVQCEYTINQSGRSFLFCDAIYMVP